MTADGIVDVKLQQFFERASSEALELDLIINNAFAGKQRLMPFFNRPDNEYLILALQPAGVSNGRNGFRKDKSGEKLSESEEDLLEHCTDAFDTLYIGCEKLPFTILSRCL